MFLTLRTIVTGSRRTFYTTVQDMKNLQIPSWKTVNIEGMLCMQNQGRDTTTPANKWLILGHSRGNFGGLAKKSKEQIEGFQVRKQVPILLH